MSQLDPPKNLTRNVLVGMLAGVFIASLCFYFQDLISESVFLGIEKYLFNLGGQIFKNLLLLIVVPLVFFSLVSGISSLSNMVKLGSIASKTVLLYLLTTAFAVMIAIFFGWVFNISGYEGEVASFNAPAGEASLYDTVLRVFPSNIFGDLIQYVLILIFVLLFHLFFTYSLVLKIFANLNPIIFFKKMRNVALFAFTTSSSAATIPVTLKTVTDELGVKKDVSSFVIPVGATINMDGTAIMQGLATMFIASTVGVDLSMIEYIQIVLLAMVASIGAAAVPSAGTITLALILSSLGLPLDAIGLILAVDRILDMIRTSVNVSGDAAVACVVANSEELLDKNIFNK